PYPLLALSAGTLNFNLKEKDEVRSGGLVARIKTPKSGAVEVRSPLNGDLESELGPDGKVVQQGEQIATISPGEEQVREALRALDFLNRDHLDCIPRTAVEETAIGTLACALLAADAKVRIDLDAAKGWMLLIGNPIHAVGDRAIRDARRRPGTAGATLGDHGEFAGFFLTRRVNAF